MLSHPFAAPLRLPRSRPSDRAENFEVQPEKRSSSHRRRHLGKESLGPMTVRLHHKYAPKHVQNFVKLAETGFFDGTTFHRTGPESFVQGGDPLSRDADPSNDGTGGPGYELAPEINEKPFVRGTVGAARMEKLDNGSQFFICLK